MTQIKLHKFKRWDGSPIKWSLLAVEQFKEHKVANLCQTRGPVPTICNSHGGIQTVCSQNPHLCHIMLKHCGSIIWASKSQRWAFCLYPWTLSRGLTGCRVFETMSSLSFGQRHTNALSRFLAHRDECPCFKQCEIHLEHTNTLPNNILNTFLQLTALGDQSLCSWTPLSWWY